MWSKKEEDRTPQQQKPVTAQPPQRAPAPEPSRPAPSYAPAPPAAGSTVIGTSVSIRGDLVSGEDLYVNGSIEGTVQVDQNRVSVGPRGKVRASIAAREVMIQGAVEGDIHARDKIIIKNEGTLVGDIQVAGIVIEDGAYFKGSIDIIRPQTQPAGPPAAAPKPAEARTAATAG